MMGILAMAMDAIVTVSSKTAGLDLKTQTIYQFALLIEVTVPEFKTNNETTATRSAAMADRLHDKSSLATRDLTRQAAKTHALNRAL